MGPPAPAASDPEADLLSAALLGGGLAPEAADCLSQAGASYADDALAERLLRRAEALAPDHAAVLIAFYRFYFYKGRLREALDIAERCLEKATRDNKLAASWQDVARGDAAFDCYSSPLPRFFMFTLKGYAYLQMRLGRLEEGRAAVAKLLELDPGDKIGAKVLLGVLNNVGAPDDA